MSTTIKEYLNKYIFGAYEDFNAKTEIKNCFDEIGLLNSDIKFTGEDVKEIDYFNKYRTPIQKFIRKYNSNCKRHLIYEINAFIKSIATYKLTKQPETKYFLQIENCRTREDILIDLLKITQKGESRTKNCSRSELLEQFCYNDKDSLSKYIQELQDGCEILCSYVKADIKRGNNTYDNTVHPIFLTLNLSQIYFLLITLQKIMKDRPDKYEYEEIASMIFYQLSDYARDIIDRKARDNGLTLKSRKPEYITEEKQWDNRKQKIMYFEKCNKIKITFQDDTEYIGRLIPGKPDQFIKENDTQPIQIDYKKIQDIIRIR